MERPNTKAAARTHNSALFTRWKKELQALSKVSRVPDDQQKCKRLQVAVRLIVE
jgi:hypothetical protein